MNFSKERALTRVIVLSCCTFMAVMGCESSEPAKTESTSIIALKDGPSAPSVLDQVVDELRWRESIKWPPKKPPNEGLTDEYWKWRINRQEELGLEDPWTEEQVCKRMDKHRCQGWNQVWESLGLRVHFEAAVRFGV